MTKQPLAIATCRVSSDEQLENNSLNRQKQAVLKAAEELGVIIPDDGWWSGSVSSKRGTNLERKDLKEMVDRCRKDKRIKYLIVDEPDRFMRSIEEAAYFEVTFRHLGVTVWYASDPELNRADLGAKLLKFTKYLSAEGSNEERIKKSIDGQTAALKEGRYPFRPKPGYRRGYERGIHEINEISGPALQKTLIRIANKLVTPSQALIELNNSDFVKVHSPIKMDKFRRIALDPYYAGIVEISKQVQVSNPNGLHIPLITKEQNKEIVRVFEGNPKSQKGPRKNGNPKYPLNNLVSCEECIDKRYGRYVGFDHGNGRNPNLIYEKYRCRSCGRYITRSELHTKIVKYIENISTNLSYKDIFIKSLNEVWKKHELDVIQEQRMLNQKNNCS